MEQQARALTGFTLLELLAALGVLATCCALAIPAYGWARGAGVAADVETALVSAVSDATRQAIVGGRQVVMCPSRDGARCDGATDWSAGWIVFTDTDRNRDRAGNEPLHRRQVAIADDVALVSTTGRRLVRFQPSGTVEGTNVTFTLCDGRGRKRAVSWIMANSGRFRRGKAAADAAHRCMAARVQA